MNPSKRMTVVTCDEEIAKISDLKIGDIVHNSGSLNTYVVTAVFDDRATAVRTIDLTNLSEWRKVVREETYEFTPD
jgi:hypothetical protein